MQKESEIHFYWIFLKLLLNYTIKKISLLYRCEFILKVKRLARLSFSDLKNASCYPNGVWKPLLFAHLNHYNYKRRLESGLRLRMSFQGRCKVIALILQAGRETPLLSLFVCTACCRRINSLIIIFLSNSCSLLLFHFWTV